MLDYENDKNPFEDRKMQIDGWKKYSTIDIQENNKLFEIADSLNQKGIKKIDSLHIACAILSKSKYFLTTDDNVLRRSKLIETINVNDPIGFIKEVLS